MKKGWGFDTKDMNKSVRPQDDFYHYANGRWLKKNPIPPHESRWGSFLILRYDTEKKLRTIVNEVSRRKGLKSGTPEQMVRDFYLSGLDLTHRNKLGISPVKPLLARIESAKDIPSLLRLLAELEPYAAMGPWGTGVDQDMKNSERYIIYIGQSGLGMPDRDYYLKTDPESVRVRTAYRTHLVKLAQLMGKSKKEAEQMRDTIMRIETALAQASMPKEDTRDMDKIYHKMSITSLQRMAPIINWRSYLDIFGAKGQREVVVMQPAFIKKVNEMFIREPLEDWKIYLALHLVNNNAGYLSSAFEKQIFSFYHTTLTGVKKMKPLWRRALGATNGSLGEVLGRIYVKKYFPATAKKKVDQLVDDLFAAYEARIKSLDWMSSATKKKALKKLHQMNRKLGYPDRWKSYRGLVIRPKTYLENAFRASRFEHRRVMRRLMKPVDRKEWFMTPQTVNAYCSFLLNDVVFPAAILQPPFFSPDADDAVNYGAIGSVIGHEITHGFDDQGSKFDGKGNRQTWWTKQDRARFEKKTRALVKQFNDYTVAGGIKVNGQLTLGENIADLGGASIAFDAYQRRLRKTGRKVIDGLTPEQRYFLALALFERENARPEFQKMLVLTNVHAPGQFRINGPASNLPEFYEAFGVKKGDKLYRPPSSRAKIW